jgi:hypothetical protein
MGDHPSEKSTCELLMQSNRPIQQKKNRTIAFSWAMVAIAFAKAHRSNRPFLSSQILPLQILDPRF